jgi:fumarylacetoacetase
MPQGSADDDAGFGPEHLPYGVFRAPGEAPRAGARLGGDVLDLAALARAGRLPVDEAVLAAPSLNPFMALGPGAWSACRAALLELARDPGRLAGATVPLGDVELLLPFAVADFVDFSSSLHHATNLGRILRPGGDPLHPNWRHLPVAYHGRAGSVVVSGTPVVRPSGQHGPDEGTPRFGPTGRLDVELELGYVIGAPSRLGEPVAVDRALAHVFGVVLVNDWSARDLQSWEYRPLGPFTGKSFATSVGAWITPLDALRRVAREPQEPEPLPYLREAPWGYDVDVALELDGEVIARSNARGVYWSIAQQIAHVTVNGAALRTGDLLATGAISGPGPRERGSLIELTADGAEPLVLGDGRRRAFLEDGDEVVLRGRAGAGIALAEVRGRVLPAAG